MPSYQARADLLKDRVILITGAGAGIGRASALHFSRAGATCILLDKNVPNLESLYDEILAQGGPEPALYPLDLEGANYTDYEEMASRIEENFGRLDGILHNAAVVGSLTPMHLYNIESWYKVMQINLHAPFMINHACLGLLTQAPDASIVFLSDAVGRKGRAYWGAYGASKFAVEGMMQILADELEQNTPVRVNSLDPGKVRTRMRTLTYPGEDPMTVPDVDTVMPALLYLMGPDSKGETGKAFLASDFT